MPSFFIDRPIFAWVVVLFICLIALSRFRCCGRPQYPIIARPRFDSRPAIRARRPKIFTTASPGLIEEDQRRLGILDFESTATRLGQVEITANFVPGTETGARRWMQEPPQARRGAVARAVIQQGFLVEESSSAVLQIITLRSTDGSSTKSDLAIS